MINKCCACFAMNMGDIHRPRIIMMKGFTDDDDVDRQILPTLLSTRSYVC